MLVKHSPAGNTLIGMVGYHPPIRKVDQTGLSLIILCGDGINAIKCLTDVVRGRDSVLSPC